MRDYEAEQQFLRPRRVPGHPDVGASSSALVNVAFRGGEPEPDRWPYDNADLARCERTYEKAPPHLQERMLPWLVKFRDHVAQKRAQREGRSFGPAGPRAVADAFAASNEMPSFAERAADRMASAARQRIEARGPSAAERVGARREVWDAVHRFHLSRDEVVVHRLSQAVGHGARGVITTIDDQGFVLCTSKSESHSANWSFRWRDVVSVIRAPGQGPSDETCEREEREARRTERERQDVDWLVFRWTELKPKVPTDESVEIPVLVLTDALNLLRAARLLQRSIRDVAQLAILANLIADVERTLGLEREERKMDEDTWAETRELLDGAIETGDAEEAARLARELAEANRVPDFVRPMRDELNNLGRLVDTLDGVTGRLADYKGREELTSQVRASIRSMWDMVSDEPLADPDAIVPTARERELVTSARRTLLHDADLGAKKRLTKDQLIGAMRIAAGQLHRAFPVVDDD